MSCLSWTRASRYFRLHMSKCQLRSIGSTGSVAPHSGKPGYFISISSGNSNSNINSHGYNNSHNSRNNRRSGIAPKWGNFVAKGSWGSTCRFLSTTANSSNNSNSDSNSKSNLNSSGHSSSSSSSDTSNTNVDSNSSSGNGNKSSSDDNSTNNTLFSKAKRFAQDWREMNAAMRPEADLPGEIPFVSPITVLRTVPLKLQIQAMKDAWRLYKLGRDPFSSKSQQVYFNVATAEEAIMEDIKDRYRKQLLREHEEAMRKKYGPSYELNLEEEAKKAKNKEEKHNEKVREIDRHVSEISDEIVKNSKQLFSTLFKGEKTADGSSKVNLRALVEERLLIMNEALSDLQDGYQDGKRTSLEEVLKNDKYLEDLESSVTKVRQKAESFVRASPLAEAVSTFYEKDLVNSGVSSSSTSSNSSSSSNNNNSSNSTGDTNSANVQQGSTISSNRNSAPEFSNKESEEMYYKILAAKKSTKEAIQKPIDRMEDMIQDDLKRQEERKETARAQADELIEKFKVGSLTGGSDLVRIISEEEAKIGYEIETRTKASTKSDEEISKKIENFASFVGSKKMKLKERYETFQQGAKDSMPVQLDGESPISGINGIKRYINQGVNQIAENLPGDPKTASTGESKPSSEAITDKNIEKIDNYLGSKVEEMGGSLRATLKGRFGSFFSTDSSSQSNEPNQPNETVVTKKTKNSTAPKSSANQENNK